MAMAVLAFLSTHRSHATITITAITTTIEPVAQEMRKASRADMHDDRHMHRVTSEACAGQFDHTAWQVIEHNASALGPALALFVQHPARPDDEKNLVSLEYA